MDGIDKGRKEAPASEGSALVMAVFILAVLTSLGIALLFVTQTEFKMGQADLLEKRAFYLAESGEEDAREALRAANAASANVSSWDEELATAAGADGTIDFNPDTVRAVYDSNGNVTGFAGTGDDVPVRALTSFGGGWYAAFLTNDPVDGRSSTDDTNDRIIIAAIGGGVNRSMEVVQAVVTSAQFPPFPATITLLGPSSLPPPSVFSGGNSNAKLLSGNDCDGLGVGIPGLSVPVVGVIGGASETSAEAGVSKPATYQSGASSGVDTVEDVSSTINPSWTNCWWVMQLGQTIKAAADVACGPAGPCSVPLGGTQPKIYYVDRDFNLPSDGVGLLWVTGDFSVSGNTAWKGAIVVAGTGNFNRNGGGNSVNPGGIIVANSAGPDGLTGTADDCSGPDGIPGNADDGFAGATYNTNGGGNHDMIYCTKYLNDAFASLPLVIDDFRQH